MNDKPYEPHPNLSDEINRNIAQSEIEGGADLRKLKVGHSLKVQTKNTTYIIKRVAPGDVDWPFLISGSERFCPVPTKARIHGSTWGGSMLKQHFIGRGMHMEFSHENNPLAYVTTTPVQEIEEITDV